MCFFKSLSLKSSNGVVFATLCLGLISLPSNVLAASQNLNTSKNQTAADGFIELKANNWWVRGKEKPVVHLVVNKTLQTINVFSNGKLVSQSRVSTGKEGHETPGGIFSILGKKRTHFSNIYSRAPMPFMQRLTWSGIALHESKSVPDYPASHGCVRLPGGFADQLFQFTKTGAQVIITKRDVRPRRFASPDIFSIENGAILEANSLRPSKNVITDIVPPNKLKKTKPLRILITRHTGREKIQEIQQILNELKYQSGEADGWMGAQTANAIKQFQKEYKHPVNGFASDELLAQLYRATGRGNPTFGRIYLRRNQRPLFDAPISIKNINTPLGTHQFSVVHSFHDIAQAASANPFWLAMSIEPTGWQGQNTTVFNEPSSASEALARLIIPNDLRRKISNMITPGTTVIISDQGISKETTEKGTDFIVLTQ